MVHYLLWIALSLRHAVESLKSYNNQAAKQTVPKDCDYDPLRNDEVVQELSFTQQVAREPLRVKWLCFVAKADVVPEADTTRVLVSNSVQLNEATDPCNECESR